MSRPSFPTTLPEFQRMFGIEEACFKFIIRSRWPEEGDFRCPACGSTDAYATLHEKRPALTCAICKHVQSATAGTVMHGSRLSLCTWLLAAWLLVTDKRGVSAKHLERTLGVSYETAYQMLQRLRAAMVNPDREQLHGRVEVDESFIGGAEPGPRGRGAKGKMMIAGAVEVREGVNTKTGEVVTRPGRIRFRHVERLTQPILFSFIIDSVKQGSTVVTDGLPLYQPLPEVGYRHRVESTVHGTDPDAVLKHYHLAVSNLKTWILGTFHGAVEAKHLQGYLNEFSFRFNRRDNLPAAFQTILGIASKVEGPSYAGIYEKGPGRFVHQNPRRGRRT